MLQVIIYHRIGEVIKMVMGQKNWYRDGSALDNENFGMDSLIGMSSDQSEEQIEDGKNK